MMNSELARQLDRLVRRQRNRIWLQRTGRRLGSAGFYCATILMLAGAVHQLLLPLDTLAIIVTATVPPLLYLCWLALTQKPTAQQGAAAADRRLGADSLLVTAWEITRADADIQRVEKLLLERCASKMSLWTDSLAAAQRVNLKPASLFSITLALAGLFFLMQASHVQPQRESQAAAERGARQTTSATARALGELLDRDVDWPPPGSAERADANGKARTLAADDARDSAPGERLAEAGERLPGAEERQPLPGNPSSGVADAAPGSARHDSDTAVAAGVGADAAPAPGTDSIEALALKQARLIDIATESAHNSTASDSASQGSALLASPARQVISPRSAGEPSRQMPAAGTSYQLSPLQRSLVWRYLAQLEENNDAKE
jgi:hypothetical protein